MRVEYESAQLGVRSALPWFAQWLAILAGVGALCTCFAGTGYFYGHYAASMENRRQIDSLQRMVDGVALNHRVR